LILGICESPCRFLPLFDEGTFIRFLRSLRANCLDDPGNKEFWMKVKEVGRKLSLISQSEATQHGGISDIRDDEADEVRLQIWSL
jgi:hypothetical protein